MMRNKYGKFLYRDVPYKAKETATFSTNVELQTGSEVNSLNKGVPTHDYASFEYGSYVTSNPKKLYKGIGGLGYVSKKVSGGDGYFEESISIVAHLEDITSVKGLTLNSRNKITRAHIVAFLDEVVVAEKLFSSYQKNNYFEFVAENINEVIITIYQIDEPWHFFGLFNIEFGRAINLDDGVVTSAEIVENYSVDGDTLEYNTLDFEIANFESENLSFDENQTIDYIVDDMVNSHFHINTSTHQNDYLTSVSAYDDIKLLETTYYGGMFSGWNVATVISHIMRGVEIDYEVSSFASAEIVDGYIPICTRRQALQMLLLGTGYRCIKKDKLYFEKMDFTPQNERIKEDVILENPQIIRKKPLKALGFKIHSYLQSQETVKLFDGHANKDENMLITFSEPVHALYAYTVDDENNETATQDVIFVERSTNYCIIKSNTTKRILIKGLKYIDFEQEFKTGNPIWSDKPPEKVFETTIFSRNFSAVFGELYENVYAHDLSINFVTLSKLEVGKSYIILGEKYIVKKVKQTLNGLYEVEAV